jgi:hypothetical protein
MPEYPRSTEDFEPNWAEGDRRESDWKNHIHAAILSACQEGDHDRAHKLIDDLQEADEEEGGAHREESPFKKLGTVNDARSSKGKETLESRERRPIGRREYHGWIRRLTKD